MMRRVLVIITLIIVLVSINWFIEAIAQDLTTMTPDQRELLLKEYQARKTGEIVPTVDEPVYRSPKTFHEQAGPQKPIPKKEESARIAGFERQEMPAFNELLPFGMELFAGPKEIDPPSEIALASDYVLGPGDNVIVYLWGRVDKEYNLTLDRQGSVILPKAGELVAWGLTLDQFKERARELLMRSYSEFEISVSLGKIRSIRVYVTGEVSQPGAYTVSSLTTLLNAIYLAGGPGQRGSMRNIRLMRRGQPKTVVDLYNFLLQGENTADIRLQTGDVIFIPVAGDRVAIRGEVKRSAIYELKGKETVNELLGLAGGMTAQAYSGRVMLERISRQLQDWEVIDLNLTPRDNQSADDGRKPLNDGDRLTVYSIFEAKKNRVAIAGRVKHPGYYERNDSTSISDLIALGQIQEYDVYMDRVDLFRHHADWRTEIIPLNLKDILSGKTGADILLTDRDSVHIYSIEDVAIDRYVYIEGEVKKPGKYPLYENLTVADLIFLAGSYTREASRFKAEIARLDSSGNVTIEYCLLDESSTATTFLRDEDHLFIRQIPEWQFDRDVVLIGEVQYPGTYTLARRDETLFGLLDRAGGFTDRAFLNGVLFRRVSIEANLNRLRVGEIAKASGELVRDSLGRVRQTDSPDIDMRTMNRVVIDVEKIISSKGADGNIVLKAGDSIYVPSIPSGISIMGAVGINGTLQFMPRKKVKDYIKLAGGFARHADKKQTQLIRANGRVIAGGKALKQRVDIGDVIVVPTRIKEDKDWLRTVTTGLTALTGALTSVFIVSKL